MADRTTIAFYIDDDGDVWATGKDDLGAYAVPQIYTPDDFRWIVANARIQDREMVDEAQIKAPADLVAKPFAWLTFHHDEGSTFLLVDHELVARNPSTGQFLFHHLIDVVGFVD